MTRSTPNIRVLVLTAAAACGCVAAVIPLAAHAQTRADSTAIVRALSRLLLEHPALRPAKGAVVVSGRTPVSLASATADAGSATLFAAELGLRNVVSADSLESCHVSKCDWTRERAGLSISPVRFVGTSAAEVDVAVYTRIRGQVRPSEIISVRVDRQKGGWGNARVVRGVAP